MECINAVRPRLWRGRGRELLGPVAYIDVDGTLAPTLGRKKAGVDMAYKGVWGCHPLIVSLANTGEVLYLVNRPGNVPSHSGAAEWIDRAVGLVAPHAERVCVRGDTDFSLTAHFDRWSEEGDFIFGYDAQPAIVKRAEVLAPDNTAAPVWADKAYRSKEIEALLEELGYESRIMRKGSAAKRLTRREEQGNRTKARVRARVEHVFGSQANDMGGTLVRSIGAMRARAHIGLRNLAYNMRRFTHLENAAPATA